MFLQCFVFLLSILLHGRAEQAISYPINWDSVPSTTPVARNLESPYLGECICDVTWGSCDPNCCCDTDCTETDRSLFKRCLPERQSYPQFDFCNTNDNNDSVMQRNGQRYLMKRREGYRAVCIVRVNQVAEELTPFFALPKEVAKPVDTTVNILLKTDTSSTYYVDGALLLLKKITGSASAQEYRAMGNLNFPLSRQDGFCASSGRHVRFMNPIDSTTCLLSGNQACSSFSTVQYENIFMTYPGNADPNTFTPVSLRIFNATSSELLASVASGSAIPAIYQTVVENNICKNAIQRIQITLVYNSQNIGLYLVSASIDLYLEDSYLKSIYALNFQATFSQSGSTPPTNYFPGTPGYFEGSLIRAGSLVQQEGKSAISERIAGFTIPSGGRLCNQGKSRKVSFLHNVRSSGCVLSISEEELRNICSASGTGSILRGILGIGSTTSTSIDYVARTNDAQVNDTMSWVKIEGLDFTDITPNFTAMERRCSNIFVGMHFKFVISRVGAENNPQDVIVGVFADAIVGSWSIQNNTDFTTSAISTQHMVFLVSFSRSDSNSRASIRRQVIAPPILPQLDDTIFYPFKPPK